MAQPYMTIHKREAGYPATKVDPSDIFVMLWRAANRAGKALLSLGRSLRPKNFQARMILMAEAFVAAQGYLLWPSNAHTLPENRANDGFRYLDL